MANSPHHNPATEDKFRMPSISVTGESGSKTQKFVLHRAKPRGESCEKTINNTLDSILELN